MKHTSLGDTCRLHVFFEEEHEISSKQFLHRNCIFFSVIVEKGGVDTSSLFSKSPVAYTREVTIESNGEDLLSPPRVFVLTTR